MISSVNMKVKLLNPYPLTQLNDVHFTLSLNNSRFPRLGGRSPASPCGSCRLNKNRMIGCTVVRLSGRVHRSFQEFFSSSQHIRLYSRVHPRSFSTMAEESNAVTEVSSNKMYDGFNKRFKHWSSTCGCNMNFSIYFPPAAANTRVPVLYWLSGLTCSDENFIQKSGAQRAAAKEGIALICTDTSPRGLNVVGENDSWDFGVGAGFYVNATEQKWKNWQMYSYVTKEIPELLGANFPQLDTTCASIFGHSMGGHGALTIFLKNVDKYKSVSAFAPICNPLSCPWGQKALPGYLGSDQSLWKEYDATELMKNYKGRKTSILIDQGDADKFLHDKQLLPDNFQAACNLAGMPLTLRMQPGYDHSYFFIATFVEDHIQHHAKALLS
eukprot:c1162_g1_i1 orf=64-1212(+)